MSPPDDDSESKIPEDSIMKSLNQEQRDFLWKIKLEELNQSFKIIQKTGIDRINKIEKKLKKFFEKDSEKLYNFVCKYLIEETDLIEETYSVSYADLVEIERKLKNINEEIQNYQDVLIDLIKNSQNS